MVILLWTLDQVVAIVLTILTGLFLAILFVLLVAPTISNECPYKSPLGWACVLVWQRVVQLLPLGVIETWDSTKKSVQLKIERDWAGATIINLSPVAAEVTFTMTSKVDLHRTSLER